MPERWTVALAAIPFLVACGDAPLGSRAVGTGAATGAPTTWDPGTGGAATTTTSSSSTADPGPPLGATVVSGGVSFRVWAPAATAVRVVGSFPGSPAGMAAGPGGTFSVVVPGAKAGDTYHFTLTTPAGSLDRLDPWCRERVDPDCRVVDPSAYAWTSGPLQRAPREETVVYELHVGSFAVDPGASQGTFASLTKRIGDLADLGVNAVELMPVQDFAGAGNLWGYSPALYLAPQPAYGTADDLRRLVDAAHQRGVGVWMDAVYNHASGSATAPLRCFDGDCPGGDAGVYFFAPGPWAVTPWGPRPDYTRPEAADLIAGSISWWLTEMRGDGLRWDSVSNIRGDDGQGTCPGGRDLILRCNALARQAGALSVAEDLKGLDLITEPAGQGGFGFDAQWDGFGYTMTSVLVPASDDGRDLGQIQGALTGSYAGDPFARLLFVEDHDTVGNGGSQIASAIDPQDPESLAARRRSMLAGVLLLTAPGVPMIFQGQDTLASGTFADPPAPLAPPTTAGLAMRAFYKDLIRLRRNLDGGAGSLAEPGVDVLHRNDSAKVLAYRRHGASGEDVIVVVNLRNQAYAEYDIGVPSAGTYRVRVDSEWKTYGADFGGGQAGPLTAVATPYDNHPCKLGLALGPYGTVILTR